MATKAMIGPGAATPRSRRVKFGSVTITAPAPSRALVEQNIALSTAALDRVAKRLARPGVALRAKKDVPQFWLDSDAPDVMIRKLNGKIERGAIVDGKFQAID